MKVLLDTNILLRSADPSHPHHVAAVDATATLLSRGEELCVVAQVIYEMWVVATRPLAQNGLGLDLSSALREVASIQEMFPLLDDSPQIFTRWKALVEAHEVLGKTAHDSRLVAAMQVHGVPALLTFNLADFARFRSTGIRILTPDEVLSKPSP